MHLPLERRIAWILTTICIVGTIATSIDVTTSAAADPKPPKRWAVLVGVDQYAHAQPLNYCGADMASLRERLLGAGFTSGRVFLLHNQATDPKYLPSKTNVELTLDLVLRAADPNDVVLLAFSGHGVHLAGTSYLCPFDSHLDDPATLISLGDVYSRFQSCPAAFKLAMIDACRNDPRQGGIRSPHGSDITEGFSRSLEKSPDGILIMSSCRPGEISTEDANLSGGHGVFMNFVIEGLEGKADDDGNGRIALGELAMYAGDRTTEYVLDKFSRVQKPSLVGDIPIKALKFELTDHLAGKVPVSTAPALNIGPESGAPSFANSIGMRFARIPAGEFLMGSPESERLRDKDEGPQHRVRITRPFYLGVYEVTKGEYAQFADAIGLPESPGWKYDAGKRLLVLDNNATWRHWGVDQSESSPVVNISWDDAQAFCRWLSDKEGRRYRLPTEAEWEYACRAGTSTAFYTGDDEAGLLGAANVADASYVKYLPKNTWAVSEDDGWPFTSPVGRFTPNAFGLYDMCGNAEEYCSDWYSDTYYSHSPEADPQGPIAGKTHVTRGGSWHDYGKARSRSAGRDHVRPATEWADVGFRVVCEAPPN